MFRPKKPKEEEESELDVEVCDQEETEKENLTGLQATIGWFCVWVSINRLVSSLIFFFFKNPKTKPTKCSKK